MHVVSTVTSLRYRGTASNHSNQTPVCHHLNQTHITLLVSEAASHLVHSFAHNCRTVAHSDTCLLKSCNLSICASLATGDDCTGMTCIDRHLPKDQVSEHSPIRRPGGAVSPAMKLTTGLSVPDLIRNSAPSSSAEPPISPIIMIPVSTPVSRAPHSHLQCLH